MKIIILLCFCDGLAGCKLSVNNNDYLLPFGVTGKNSVGFKNQKGEVIIPTGKYLNCFTDTFRTFAIVLKPDTGLVGIDRQEHVLYKVFPFDNGPDEPSGGFFRITGNNKIGFADSATGRIAIKPQFSCAFPFENGVAKVSDDCKTESDGEHNSWISNNWYYVDKTGKKVGQPKKASE